MCRPKEFGGGGGQYGLGFLLQNICRMKISSSPRMIKDHSFGGVFIRSNTCSNGGCTHGGNGKITQF
jgi:hypothetical protein